MAVAVLFTSERVGCAWQVRAMSSDEAPYSIPSTASAIISPRVWRWRWGLALGERSRLGLGWRLGLRLNLELRLGSG